MSNPNSLTSGIFENLRNHFLHFLSVRSSFNIVFFVLHTNASSSALHAVSPLFSEANRYDITVAAPSCMSLLHPSICVRSPSNGLAPHCTFFVSVSGMVLHSTALPSSPGKPRILAPSASSCFTDQLLTTSSLACIQIALIMSVAPLTTAALLYFCLSVQFSSDLIPPSLLDVNDLTLRLSLNSMCFGSLYPRLLL